MRWLAGTVCCLLLVPHGVLAAVRINEVAWMGTSESYLCDWIELYNQSDAPVDVTQWTFEIGDTVRQIADGEGDTAIVPGRGFLLLERVTNTCPDPVPEISGWYLSLGNVPNAGTTLTLRRADGSMADRVVGGEAWENIGGDNDSKETAQRTSAGWVTASPTPGQQNQPTAVSADSESATVTEDTDESASTLRLYDPEEGGGGHTLGANDHELVLDITAPGTTYVGQPIDLSVTPSGVGDGVAQSLHYQWNFGDRHTTTQKEPTHTYTFPGTYVVTVRGTYNGYEAETRHEVTVLPVRLTIGRDQSGNIQLHNTAPYELDLSRYTVTGAESITLPARTILLPEQTLTIERSEIENDMLGLVTVRDRQQAVVASNLDMVRDEYLAGATSNDLSSRPQVAGRVTTATAPRPTATTTAADTSLSEPSAATTTGRFVTEPPSPTEETAMFGQVDWRTLWPYAALLGLVILTVGFLFWPTRRPQENSTTAEWFE